MYSIYLATTLRDCNYLQKGVFEFISAHSEQLNLDIQGPVSEFGPAIERSNGLLAIVDGINFNDQCLSEISYALSLGKPVVCVRNILGNSNPVASHYDYILRSKIDDNIHTDISGALESLVSKVNISK